MIRTFYTSPALPAVGDPVLAARIRKHLVPPRDDEYSSAPPTTDVPDGFGAAGGWARRFREDMRNYLDGRLAWRDVEARIVLDDGNGAGALDLVERVAAGSGLPVLRFGQLDFPDPDLPYLDGMARLRTRLSMAFLRQPTFIVVELPRHRADERDPQSGSGSPFAEILFEVLEATKPPAGFPVATVVPSASTVRAALHHPSRLGRTVIVGYPSARDLARALSDELGVLPAEFVMRSIRHLQNRATFATVAHMARDIRRRARAFDRPVRPEDLLHVSRRDDRPASERLRIAANVAGRLVPLLLDGSIPELATVLGSISLSREAGDPDGHDPATSAIVDQGELFRLWAGRAAEELMTGSNWTTRTGTRCRSEIDGRAFPDIERDQVEVESAYAHADAITLISGRIAEVAELTAMLLERLSLDRNELDDFARRTGLIRDAPAD
ncbi:hypothetical protein [Aureimonas phyllosphaerae]|uniref:Uncharacterized protein n=1 Tax=Aureimonas phyllosphaerae TaxID=1166078 RepID=A0A7W6BUM1_9HYPH|nr:hypothetical protein [Aureimonas phyllosphaerae]MBB3937222.1 hypothetical protein [Aureimonas phyllosphaerae]MBB3961141.1 hypothetical protein [Aureimonas phyllosphaerae]SFF49126.1 hypothetical protein SAMN05216566_11750 [Aureimonas phyllosphaerae]